MKKYNSKQNAHSQKIVREALLRTFFRFLFIAVMAFVIPTLAHALNDPTAVGTAIKTSGIFVFFTMANIGSISQPSSTETAGKQVGFRMWLVATDQIDGTSFPLPNASRELGNIPLNSGEYWHHFDGISDSLKYIATGEKGDVNSTFKKTFSIIIKHSVATLNFLESFTGKGFCLVYKECESTTKYELGSYCKPIVLEGFEVKNDGDGKYISLTFGNEHWRQELLYVGTISEQSAEVIAADATALAVVSGNDAYQLTNNTVPSVIATVSGIASADEGRNITITAPAVVTNVTTIADNTVYILKDGATWTANAGSSITFQIMDDSTLIEKSRVQTA